MREQLAVSHVKRQARFVGIATSSGQRAIGELAAVFVQQDLGDPPELIDEAGHAGVRRPHHREARFDAAENSIREMLLRSGRAQEPAVIGHIGEQIRAAEDKLPRQVTNRVFEANQRRDQCLVIREVKHCVLFPETEIARHLIAHDASEQRDRVPARNVFAKRHQMDLSIDLDAIASIGNQHRGVIIMGFIQIDRAQEQIGFGRCRKIHDEAVAQFVVQHGTRHGAFRPNNQFRPDGSAKSGSAQASELLERFPG